MIQIGKYLKEQTEISSQSVRWMKAKLKKKHLKVRGKKNLGKYPKQTEISSQSAGRSRADSPIYHHKLATGDAKQHDDDGDSDDHGDDGFPFKCNFMV